MKVEGALVIPEQGLGTTDLVSGLIGVKKMSNNPEIESDQAYTNRHYFRDHTYLS